MSFSDDTMLASALLHDVCEDCGVKLEGLSFSSTMRDAVSLLTKNPEHFQEAGCAAALAKYYSGIHGNQDGYAYQMPGSVQQSVHDGL